MANKQLLQSAGDGTAVPAGYVGERVTWASAPSDQSVTYSEVDWNLATITLQPGVWHVVANVSCSLRTGTVLNSATMCIVKITDSSGNVIQEMDKRARIEQNTTTYIGITTSIPFSFIANVTSANTVYKIRVVKNDDNSAGTVSVLNSGNHRSQFYGVRIA